ncbi:hypothetical protein [Bifidobacterium animalis]|uniref:hypothetical protein n=1 Tax=Bifidobacterium animalis TaxID=28025 RepID=UPI0011D21F2B|nr:hypothetical protein [Bifidobacterium animalis]
MVPIIYGRETLRGFPAKITKHLHIFLAQKNTFCENLPEITPKCGSEGANARLQSFPIDFPVEKEKSLCQYGAMLWGRLTL